VVQREQYGQLFEGRMPDQAYLLTYEDTASALRKFTAHRIYEEIARGMIPGEFAIKYNISMMHFDRFMSEDPVIDKTDYARSLRLCASTLAIKSKTVLEMTPESNIEGQMMKEYSKRALDLAERIAPDTWAAARRTTDTGDRPTIQIAIMAPPGSIPGLDLLTGAGKP
jgi:hypothetical protein